MPEVKLEPRHQKPKILLVDLSANTQTSLIEEGFNIRSGSFGKRYRVKKSDNYYPVVADSILPNYTEQEVIILDLTPTEIEDSFDESQLPARGHPQWLAKATWGIIDPRPRAMTQVRDDWYRIFKAGGLFVVFSQPRYRQNLIFASPPDRPTDLPYDNWSFLPFFTDDYLHVEEDEGTESVVLESVDFLEHFLQAHQSELQFEAVFTPKFAERTYKSQKINFCPLMNNKYGDCISGIVYAEMPCKGQVLLLPQFKDKERITFELVTTVLPELSRRLFPDFQGDRWIHSDVYEHATVLEKRKAQCRINDEAKLKVLAIEAEIQEEMKRMAFLHGILTNTGDKLVTDVRLLLEYIGFQQVKQPEEEQGTNKQEDLQIHDRTPTLLLEVKGISGMPTEKDTHQVTKYVLRRSREWDRRDVCGIFLVNHQRNIPALQRDHENVFTTQQINDAVENEMGLMTTWDLFRLVKGMIEWKWNSQDIQSVFYGKGRLPNLPSHYTMNGKISHFYHGASVISLEVGDCGLRIGDVVGFLLTTGFYQETVTSIEVNKKPVPEATPGQRAGYKTSL